MDGNLNRAAQLTSRICLGVMRRSREPVFCSSTVVRGRGFLLVIPSRSVRLSLALTSEQPTTSASAWSAERSRWPLGRPRISYRASQLPPCQIVALASRRRRLMSLLARSRHEDTRTAQRRKLVLARTGRRRIQVSEIDRDLRRESGVRESLRRTGFNEP